MIPIWSNFNAGYFRGSFSTDATSYQAWFWIADILNLVIGVGSIIINGIARWVMYFFCGIGFFKWLRDRKDENEQPAACNRNCIMPI